MPDDDLLAFLTARLDETEATARAAEEQNWHRSMYVGDEYNYAQVIDRPPNAHGWTDCSAEVIAECGRDGDYADGRHRAEHIAAHDPCAVLADVEAKRDLIDAIRFLQDDLDAEFGVQTPDGEIEALRILASCYRHHPGWRAEWAPETTP